jgi:hypothetical protein
MRPVPHPPALVKRYALPGWELAFEKGSQENQQKTRAKLFGKTPIHDPSILATKCRTFGYNMD